MTPNLQTHPETNLDIATYLRALGIPVVRVDTTNPQSLVWHFAQPERCIELTADYFQGRANVDAQRLLLESKRLKDEIFALRRRHEGIRNERYR